MTERFNANLPTFSMKGWASKGKNKCFFHPLMMFRHEAFINFSHSFLLLFYRIYKGTS